MPARLLKKPVPVRPRPFKILCKVWFRYRNGQIQARVRIKSPARVLRKKKFPRKRPKSRKRTVKLIPSGRQKDTVFRTVPGKACVVPGSLGFGYGGQQHD